MIEVKSIVRKYGNSYYLLIPKALFECKILDEKHEIIAQIEQKLTQIENKMGLLCSLFAQNFWKVGY